MIKSSILAVAVSSLIVFSGCGKKSTSTETTTDSTTSDSTSNSSQSTISEAGSHASATESGSAGLLMDSLANVEDSLVDPADQVRPLGACSYASARGSCSSNSATVTWGGCTVASGLITLTGGWTETFTGTDASTCTVPVSSGGTVTRTTSSEIATLASGATLTINSTSATATWDGDTVNGGVTVTNSSGTRTITINGVSKVLASAAGTTIFNHSIKTTTPLTVTGSRLLGTRTISSGTIKLYHNIARYNASSTFSSVTWGSASCCYPTSGSISTTLSGSASGTTSLTFTSSCGSATYEDTSGSSPTITLNQCR